MQSVEFSNLRNACEFSMRMSDAASRMSSLTEFCTLSNRRPSLLLLSCIVVVSRITGSEESRHPNQRPDSTKRVSSATGFHSAATTEYGLRFTSVLWRDNLFACQFHPEKSQMLGLQLLKNFASLT